MRSLIARSTGAHTSRTALLLWALPLAFLLVFFFWPLGQIFHTSWSEGQVGGLGWDSFYRVWKPLRFTVYQAGLSTLLTLAIGLPSAYLFARFRFPGKRLLRVLTTIPFILPTVVVAASINALLGPRGWVNLGLMSLFNLSTPPAQILNTLGAILLAHVFYNTSIVIRGVASAWTAMDPRLEQSARTLGASRWAAFREVTLPLLRPYVLAAALLVFLFDFTSFGVVLLLGGPRFSTLEVEIYVQAMEMLNLPLAGLLSLAQLLFTLALTAWYSSINARLSIPIAPKSEQVTTRRPRGFWERIMVGGLVTVLLVLQVTPLAALGLRSVARLEAARGERGVTQPGITVQYYRELFVNRQQSIFYVPPIEAARNSLIFAGLTLLISLPLGFLAAYALNRTAWVNRLLDPLLMLPLGTSAVTLGLGFILTFNQRPWTLWTAGSFPWLIPIAHSLVALPFVVRSLQPALASIPVRLRQAAAVMGANPLRVWWEIDLPIIVRAALGSAIFAFAISLGEFGATSFLARPEYPTLPVAIFRFLSLPGALNYGQALAMATILMVITSLGILVIDRFELPGGSL